MTESVHLSRVRLALLPAFWGPLPPPNLHPVYPSPPTAIYNNGTFAIGLLLHISRLSLGLVRWLDAPITLSFRANDA